MILRTLEMKIVSFNLSKFEARATGLKDLTESGLSFFPERCLNMGMMSILQNDESKSLLFIMLYTIDVKKVGFALKADFK